MNFATIKSKAKALLDEASFISEIKNEADYENALALMEDLIEDYEKNRMLISILANSIEAWESTSPEFAEFNQRIMELDDGVAVLRTLLDQYHLKADDLKNESGSKRLMLEACREAIDVLLDHRLFLLDEQQFQAFEEVLSHPSWIKTSNNESTNSCSQYHLRVRR